MIDVFEHLQKLTETPGPSGYEMKIATVVQEAWQPTVDTLTVDRVGSLVAVKRGQGDEPRPRLLLAAHMDEIGLIVSKILAHPDEDEGHGFLRVSNVGGVDIRHLYGQMVVVHSSRNGGRELVGVIGALPRHLLPEERRDKAHGYDDLVVDVGLPAAELRQLVSVGDFISFRQPLRKLLNKRAAGKSLDNRASVAAVTVCLEYLAGRRHQWDVVAVATAQEETGLLGAYTSAHAQKPDAAVAIDVTFGKGPGSSDAGTFELDEGPAIGMGPNVHPGMFKALKATAEALEMKVHTEPHARYSGTDAFGLQIAREGIPTGLVGIPLRYMHTMVETLAVADVERAGRLLGEFIVRLDGRFLDSLAREMLGE
ncbi:MAG: M20/M25/M40 family metallo-hydrolase [Chloroflexi bacterium]|nr:M20/M25/M40 family metallo-hydrolase [Chloroflexota bacterium]MCI0579512.1 M20/M25/M40 family metallo-hydrolase [Chloroflexota bacterium]MCI0647276.1 M20/M25/M40 family metallo-hydrolase [Chloroflexota bacterium]MCI0729315.1 M20/M25/M40 family metallo-hydrolase [Chloroflexota bacterium]